MIAPRLNLIVLLALLPALGCGGGVYVRPSHSAMPLLDSWRSSIVGTGQLSARTQQTLRQYDLDSTYRRHPEAAAATLLAEALHETNPDLLFALSEIYYQMGRDAERSNDAQAVCHYYLCAGYAYHFLFSTAKPLEKGDAPLTPIDVFDPRFRLACDLYNAGLGKCIAAGQRVGRLDPRQELRLPTTDGKGFTLLVAHVGFLWEPNEFGPLLPCDEFQVVGLNNYHRTYGLGVPLIGTRSPQAPLRLKYYPREVSFPVTAFLRFDGDLAQLAQKRVGQIELYNPLTVQNTQVRGLRVPLETDLTTPLAHFLARSDLNDATAYLGFLHADELLNREGIYMLEPYSPGKIPVVLVHGLLSSPLTWAPLINDIIADPVLRERYQFWVYFYPTSDPLLATAADLRRSLEELRHDIDPDKRDPALDQMVFVGHSMGGLVSRLQTVASDNDFWKAQSDRPFQTLKLSPTVRSEIEPLYFFPRESCIKRAIFIGTPHEGSRISPSFVGQFANRVAGLPKKLLAATRDLAQENPGLALRYDLKNLPSSVDTLAPGSIDLVTLAAKPRPEEVLYHSIVGIAPAGTAQFERWLSGSEPGDGVVPYRSAHLESANSEKIVPADHYHVHQHPLAILEVRRILFEHLQSH